MIFVNLCPLLIVRLGHKMFPHLNNLAQNHHRTKNYINRKIFGEKENRLNLRSGKYRVSANSVSEALKLNSPGMKYHRRVEILMSLNKPELEIFMDMTKNSISYV